MDTRTKGGLGEDAACRSLEKQGHMIICRNYLKKYGELDIISEHLGTIHFTEVKSITGGIADQAGAANLGHRPEENVHDLKIRKIRRMVQTFFDEKGIGQEVDFQFHVACVYMNMQTRKARIKWIKNIIL
jgi:putative endonuclease